MTDRAIRLTELLENMRGQTSKRKFARDLRLSYASLIAYLNGDQFPETDNQIKIAEKLRWTQEELLAYLDDRPVSRTKSIAPLLQEIRAIDTLEDAEQAARVALEQVVRLAKQGQSN
jgi:hypothetical protein